MNNRANCFFYFRSIITKSTSAKILQRNEGNDKNAKIGYKYNANSLRWYIEILAGKFDSIWLYCYTGISWVFGNLWNILNINCSNCPDKILILWINIHFTGNTHWQTKGARSESQNTCRVANKIIKTRNYPGFYYKIKLSRHQHFINSMYNTVICMNVSNYYFRIVYKYFTTFDMDGYIFTIYSFSNHTIK